MPIRSTFNVLATGRVLIVLAALGLSGCAPATRPITVPSTAKAVPVAESATLLISNTVGYAVVNILDADGKVVTQLINRSHTVLHVPAGALKLYAIPETQGSWGDRVAGTVEAGRLYHLEIGLRYGGASFKVLSPRTDPEGWKQRMEHETELTNVELDETKVAGLVKELGDTKKLLAEVEEAYAGHDDPEDIPARTIQVTDGEK